MILSQKIQIFFVITITYVILTTYSMYKNALSVRILYYVESTDSLNPEKSVLYFCICMYAYLSLCIIKLLVCVPLLLRTDIFITIITCLRTSFTTYAYYYNNYNNFVHRYKKGIGVRILYYV